MTLDKARALLDQATMRVMDIANPNIRVVRRDEAEAIVREVLSTTESSNTSKLGRWVPPFHYDSTKGYIVDAQGDHVCPTRSATSDSENQLIADALNAFTKPVSASASSSEWVDVAIAMLHELRMDYAPGALADTDGVKAIRLLRKEVARYRWWRERFAGDDEAMDEINDAFSKGADSPAEVDAAIDAAMRREQSDIHDAGQKP